jgi:hypothetical protein
MINNLGRHCQDHGSPFGIMFKSARVMRARFFSSVIFDRQLKSSQKKWASMQKDAFNAAGGLRNEIDDRLVEMMRV